jgi:hypothetical protein
LIVIEVESKRSRRETQHSIEEISDRVCWSCSCEMNF